MKFTILTCILTRVFGDCAAGTDIGAFIIKTPNRTSVIVVGSPFKVEWEYTPLVKQLPSEVDISLENVLIDGPRKFGIVVARNLTISGTSTIWNVDQLNDGQYQLRIGIAGRDPLLNKDSCLQNGEAYGGSSAIFKITNPKQSPPIIPSKFGPETSLGSKICSLSIVNLVIIAILLQ